ncbi:ead/Ea22-like family protein [Cronobacter sakazakii]|uniref:ead/Ea22-like family protein n=1 Tax=Cronobacter sakazakii TaxID=28141 RepID=UPI0018F8B03F|nr:ead/Ea22-like family protein [Cronobacter sakazakii]
MTIDTAKLKAAAEKARWGDWSAYKPHSGARGYEVRVGSEAVAQHCLKDDAAFIAAASPKAVLELIAALEDAQKRGTDMEVACELFAESKLAQIKLEAALGIAQQRLAELEARNLEVIIPPRRCHDYASVAVQQRDEQWYKALHDACDRAGINLEAGGEA